MAEQNDLQAQLQELAGLNDSGHPEWDEPIVCRVEVDLPGWLTQLARGNEGRCIAKTKMRTVLASLCVKTLLKKQQKQQKQQR